MLINQKFPRPLGIWCTVNKQLSHFLVVASLEVLERLTMQLQAAASVGKHIRSFSDHSLTGGWVIRGYKSLAKDKSTQASGDTICQLQAKKVARCLN